MGHFKLFEQFMNEGKIEMDYSHIQGKKYESKIAGTAYDIKDFEKMIKAIPETVKSIEVPTKAQHFTPPKEKFEGPITSSIKSKIIKIVKDVAKQYENQKDPVVSFSISSYYSVGKNEVNDPFYIQFRTKGSEDFGNKMSSGFYGSLD
jgi:hypothetical protein